MLFTQQERADYDIKTTHCDGNDPIIGLVSNVVSTIQLDIPIRRPHQTERTACIIDTPTKENITYSGSSFMTALLETWHVG